MAGTAALYYSIGAEPGTHGLVYALWKRGAYVLLPVLRPDLDLDWASYEGPDSLRAGPRGLAEATTAPWPGSARRSPRSRSSTTPSCSTRCPPPPTTSGFGWWRGRKRE